MPLDAAPIKPPASVQQPAQGRRGNRQREQQDVSHLLGFTLPPRAPPPPPTHLPRRSTRRASHSGAGQGTAAYTRARFVHQFRFVVAPDKDYTAHFADPDIHLEWADILQVILPTGGGALNAVATAKLDQAGEGGRPACPICLSEPTAARMTKCGHVFCYPCVLHYLALADPGTKSRKCPVCHDFIHAKDLKSVKWFDPANSSARPSSPPSAIPPNLPPAEHVDADLARALELSRLDSLPSSSAAAAPQRETLRMRLVRRPQITTLALPRSPSWPSEAVPPLRAPWQFTPDALAYAKFMLGAPDYIHDELVSQRGELERELASLRRLRARGGPGAGDDELGVVFVEDALRRVDEQLAKCDLLKTTGVMTARKKTLRELQAVVERHAAGSSEHQLPPVTDTSASELDGEPEPRSVHAPAPPVPVVHDPIPLDFLHSRGGGSSSGPGLAALSSTATPFVPGGGGGGLATTSSSSLAPTVAPLSPPRKSPYQRRNVLPPPAESDDPAYYFYQAASGQPIFLQPLDIRILKSHFGTYQAMPDELVVPIEGADEGSMNAELRRRCKWLAHLPLSSDVVFVEADLSHLVSRRAMEPFQTALKQRRTKRRDKARKEDRAKVRAEEKAREQLPQFAESFGAYGAPASDGLPWGFAAAHSSSWDDVHAFPAPPSAGRGAQAPAPTSGDEDAGGGGRSRPSFASALHASSRPSWSGAGGGGGGGASSSWDDAFDDRWGEFEERLGRQRAAGGGTPSPANAGTPQRNVNVSEGGGQGKKGKGGGGRKGKVTLSLTAGR
ncbi:hypothetical protein JCM9279_007107 [Rhodotorula babjevae]